MLRNRKIVLPDNKVIIYDSFTGVDGTLLANHNPDINKSGQVWFYTTNQQIINNTATNVGADSGGYIQSNQSDCILTAKFFSSYDSAQIITRQPALLFRWNGTNSFKVIANIYANTFSIVNPSGSTIATKSTTLIKNTWYTIQAIISGSNITATLDGVNTISAVDSSNIGETIHGYWNYRYVPHLGYLTYCDDFEVRKL